MSTHLVGSIVKIQITVTDPDTGALTPAVVSLTIKDPSGNETAVVPDNPSLGVYEHFLTLDEPGWFTAVWTAEAGEYVTVQDCSVCAEASVLVGS